LICPQLLPLERLNRCLRRGRGFAAFRSELSLLASLLRHEIRFMVVGDSAAALQGAPVVTEDVNRLRDRFLYSRTGNGWKLERLSP